MCTYACVCVIYMYMITYVISEYYGALTIYNCGSWFSSPCKALCLTLELGVCRAGIPEGKTLLEPIRTDWNLCPSQLKEGPGKQGSVVGSAAVLH